MQIKERCFPETFSYDKGDLKGFQTNFESGYRTRYRAL